MSRLQRLPRVVILAAAVAALWMAHTQLTAATSVVPESTKKSARSIDLRAGCHSNEQHQSEKRNGDASFEVQHPGAHFLVFHFRSVRLDANTTITILDLERPDAPPQSYNHTNMSADQDLFTPPVYSSHVAIHYATGSGSGDDSDDHASSACPGFHIDEYRFAAFVPDPYYHDNHEPSAHVHTKEPQQQQSGECTSATDESKEAACLAFDASVFEASRPIVRLLIQKSYGAIFCTGWLLGCEGHVLTSHHCVSQDSEASATTIEFLAQGDTCAQQCDAPKLCPGKVVARSVQIVAFSPEQELDYVLLLPKLSPSQLTQMVADYGFLSMRAGSVALDEQIFIPQHPAGFGKRIALKHDAQYARVLATTESSCNSRNDSLAYLLDTQGGSSGAPVIASGDMSVVGVHYCGGTCVSMCVVDACIGLSRQLTDRLCLCYEWR